MKLMVTKRRAIIMRYAAMMGMSTFCTACRNRRPMPGHWNTVSVMMANAINAPIWRPVMVMTGTSVFLSAWPKWMVRARRPRARAKRM